MGATRPEAAEKTDAGRVAPIRGSVFYQIDKLKSGFEVMGRTVMPGNCALMGATRLASGIFQQPRPAEKCNAHTQNKDSQTALNTRLSVSLCLKFRREKRRPH